ncbi:hypothetical protein ACLI1A_05535 [Flavobacterium sp. RHBU_3]|uniref:hypothetical protein n=1 Tax=Flavobacterium sp. RHBU_3 TaxID=3391184 RepID=UPI003984A254
MLTQLTKYCANCAQNIHLEVNDTATTFSDYENLIALPCNNCNMNVFNHIDLNTIKIDKQILDVWGKHPNLYFFEQDEEIILADEANIALFIDAIDNSNYLQFKKEILLTALCVLFYDNRVKDDGYTEEENEVRKGIALNILPYLKLKKGMIHKLPDWLLLDYIKDVLFLEIKILE